MKNTVKVRGRDIEYGVDDEGIFKAEWEGEEYKHPTLAGLKAALDRKLKQKRVAIPIISIDDDFYSEKLSIKKGIVTGKHNANRNLLVKWDGSAVPQQTRSFHDKVLKGDTDLTRLKTLHRELCAAYQKYENFKRANEFDDSVLLAGEEA